MKYLATINVPGYLPMDDDPPTFDTARDAWQYLAEERQRAEDDAFDASVAFTEQDEGYSATVNTMERLATGDFQPEFGVNDDGTGWVHGDTPGYDGIHDLGLAYHVTVCEPCDEHPEGEDGHCTVCGADFTAEEVVITHYPGKIFLDPSTGEFTGTAPEDWR